MLVDPKWVFYTLLGLVIDALDMVIMRLVSRPEQSLAPSDVDHLSDEEIFEIMAVPPCIGNAKEENAKDFTSVRRISQNTVVKGGESFFHFTTSVEANALNLVFAKTTIPVPRVHRVIDNLGDSFLIVMDYIPGQTLAEAWPALSMWQKFSIACTLRRYIRQLRRLKASSTTPPGPVSENGPQTCISPTFGYYTLERGPFASYAELSHFYNELFKAIADRTHTPLDDPSRKDTFDDSEPLVLTHQDLHMKNIILGKDGRVWIIDWAWSGYYPPWFEYVTMQKQNWAGLRTGTDDKFWKMLIPFITGPYFRQEKSFDRMTSGQLYE